MGVSYFKRFRMEIELPHGWMPLPVLPEGFAWEPWHPDLLERHAAIKYGSFHGEIDSQVFACLGEYDGCLRLMNDIAGRDTFIPEATWMIVRVDPSGRWIDDCATIQGVVQKGPIGAVQNVGVVPAYRGLGLGRALVLKSLFGFRHVRLQQVYLEVTARNTPAVELYRSLGFRLTQTTYKVVDCESVVTA